MYVGWEKNSVGAGLVISFGLMSASLGASVALEANVLKW